MKYKNESGPHEHTCTRCGRHQKVREYGQDPSFTVGETETFTEDATRVVEAQMLVNLEQYFECIACGYTTRFDESLVDTGVEVDMATDDRIDTAVQKIRRVFRKENDVEEFL